MIRQNVDTPTVNRQRDLTTSRGLPANEPYRGFFKRTHLHTTLNKSRDERTDYIPVRADRWRDRSHATAEWFEFQFSAIRDRRHWCSGNIGASQALAPGSIPGWRTVLVNHYPIGGMVEEHNEAYLLGLLAKIKCSICS